MHTRKQGRTKRALAVQFFYKHAGYSYNVAQGETKEQGKRRAARAYADAEAWASREGLVYDWLYDDMPCDGCDCGSDDCDCSTGAAHETLGCVLYRPCPDHGIDCKHAEVLQSLWGICGATSEYRRVVEAELALEAMPSQGAI